MKRALCWAAAVSLILVGAVSQTTAQEKDLGGVVPSEYPLCMTIPNVKQAYERYQVTGIGKLFASPPMAPFVTELRKTGAISLCNWQGILGFEEKLLSQFPGQGVVMAVPPKPAPVVPKGAVAPPKAKGNIVVLLESKDVAAIDACLKSADTYHSGQKAVKSADKIPGTTQVVVFNTPASGSHAALQHVYFVTESGFFGIGSNLAAVKEYLALKIKPDEALTANPQYISGRKQLKPTTDIFIYSRPLETLDLWEDKPKKGKSNVQKMQSQGFRHLRAITAAVQFTGAAHDVDYQAIFFVKADETKAGEKAKEAFTRGMRVLKLSPGPEEKVPAWLPSGLAELSQFNHDQDMLFLARADWYDELEADGQDGVFMDLMNNVKTDDKGVKVDFRKDVFGNLKEAQLQAIDVRGAVTKHNPLGRMSVKIADSPKIDAVTKALTAFYAVDVKKGEVNLEQIGDAKIWWVPPPQSLLISAKSTGGQQVNTMAVVDTYYIMANDTELVRALVKKAYDFSKDKVMADLAVENRKLQSAQTGARSAVRWEEMWAAPFEAVRSADPVYNGEREVKLLRSMLTGDNTLKYAGLYKLLPPFSAAKPFLSPAGSTIDMTPDGFTLRGFILKP